MKDIFKLRMTNRPTQERYKMNLEIRNWNQVTFGTPWPLEIPWPKGSELFNIAHKFFRKPEHF